VKKMLLAVAAAFASAGCNPVVPTGTLNVTQTMTFTYAEVLGAAVIAVAAWYVIDPLAPNWQIKDSKLDDAHYRIDLRMKPVTTGGVGEAEDLFHRQAEAIATRTKSPGYLVLSWNEGVESQFPIARRWGRGVIQVQPAVAALQQP